MTILRRGLRLAHRVERTVDEVHRRTRDRVRRWGTPVVVPYLGHGNLEELRIRGRVLAGWRASAPHVAAGPSLRTRLRNLRVSARRFLSREVPGVGVVVRGTGTEVAVETDDEGYFEALLPVGVDLHPRVAWVPVEMEMPAVPGRGLPAAKATGRARVPGKGTVTGVISDLDDTVLRTGATSLTTMLRTTLLESARSRLPFPGVAALYRGLEGGVDGTALNPIFYVSSSPWNLYDLLTDFLEHRGVPAGPLFLRDIGLGPEGLRLAGGHGRHKLARIREILALHPDLSFVLVGDSGQRDPEIYAEVVRSWPGRVRAVYIRDVSPDDRDRAVDALAEELRPHAVDVLRVRDSLAAAEHAASLELMTPQGVEEVRQAVREGDAPHPAIR